MEDPCVRCGRDEEECRCDEPPALIEGQEELFQAAEPDEKAGPAWA
jgi:hypothetical protein